MPKWPIIALPARWGERNTPPSIDPLEASPRPLLPPAWRCWMPWRGIPSAWPCCWGTSCSCTPWRSTAWAKSGTWRRRWPCLRGRQPLASPGISRRSWCLGEIQRGHASTYWETNMINLLGWWSGSTLDGYFNPLILCALFWGHSGYWWWYITYEGTDDDI